AGGPDQGAGGLGDPAHALDRLHPRQRVQQRIGRVRRPCERRGRGRAHPALPASAIRIASICWATPARTSPASDTTTQLVGSRLGSSTSSDRKSTRLNSSHVKISYAVFCLKKKTTVA